MNKEEYDKYKKVVQNLDGYDICDEFNLCTYELKDKEKLLEIVLIHYFKIQDDMNKVIEYIRKESTDISMVDKMNILDMLRR